MPARYGRRQGRQCAAAAGIALAFAGCAAPPATPSPAARQPWAFDGRAGIQIDTPHYRLLTTVRDAQTLDRFCRLMESAHADYAALVPPASVQATPLEILLFERPDEWESYTRRLVGRDAAVYLSVGPGGYTYGDRVVCWLFNPSDLWGVAAHEGFHQYVARHLRQRLPPALEEGLATTFETVTVTDTSVTFDRRRNARRAAGLAGTRAAPLPLETLVRLNAGDIAGSALAVREGFYGQCWALARLLLEDPVYAPRLRVMLLALRDGRAADHVGGPGGVYYPAAARPLLTHTVAPDWSALARALEEASRRFGADADDRR